MTGISGIFALKRRSPSSPSMPGMRRSVTIASNGRPVEGGERLGDRAEVVHGVAPPEDPLHHLARGVEVVDDHEFGFSLTRCLPLGLRRGGLRRPRGGSRTRKCAPAPGALSTSTVPPCASAACADDGEPEAGARRPWS